MKSEEARLREQLEVALARGERLRTSFDNVRAEKNKLKEEAAAEVGRAILRNSAQFCAIL